MAALSELELGLGILSADYSAMKLKKLFEVSSAFKAMFWFLVHPNL